VAAYHHRQRPGESRLVESLHSSQVPWTVLCKQGHPDSSRVAGSPGSLGREERVTSSTWNGSVRIRIPYHRKPRPPRIDATIGRRLGNGDGGNTSNAQPGAIHGTKPRRKLSGRDANQMLTGPKVKLHWPRAACEWPGRTYAVQGGRWTFQRDAPECALNATARASEPGSKSYGIVRVKISKRRGGVQALR
jgi:hypothetical protein